ncbi:MAG: hypothetical protein AB7I33_06365 [Gemmatimonadales bacterium]
MTPVGAAVGNWVDRGETPVPRLARVLGEYLEGEPDATGDWLEEQALIVLGMVDAGASESEVCDYLTYMDRTLDRQDTPVPARQAIATLIWHIAKVALVRDHLLARLENPATF